MTLVQLKKALIERIEKMPEAELKQLLEKLDDKEKTIDILSCKEKILRENHEVFKKLAQ